MKILIYGTGGVGGYFGGKLAQAGNDVTFFARGEHLAAIRSEGLKVLSPRGDFDIPNPKATDNIADLPPLDLVLLGVKSWQVKAAVSSVKALMKQDTIIIPLQNGISANREIIEVAGKSNLLGGLCKIISRIESPGVIRHMMYDPVITIGELDHQPSSRVEKIRALFEKAGISVTVAKHIDADLWKKFMFICTSGLGALTRSSYGIMREMPETRRLLVALITEIHSIAKHLHIPLREDAVVLTMKVIDNLPYEATSSMQRDVMEGRPSELEYLTGEVVRLGSACGIDTPVNSFIYHCLLPMERSNRTAYAKQ